MNRRYVKNSVKSYENLLHLIVIPPLVFGVVLANYWLLAVVFLIAIPLNYLIYKQYKKKDKQKGFLKNKLKALGVGGVFFFLILANSKYGFF